MYYNTDQSKQVLCPLGAGYLLHFLLVKDCFSPLFTDRLRKQADKAVWFTDSL